ncbi:MAG: hypothetical protein WDZ85_01660 [Candidatus Paceibacterota bacterium]
MRIVDNKGKGMWYMCIEALEKEFWEEIAPLLRENIDTEDVYTIEDAERDLATIEPEDLPEGWSEAMLKRVRDKLRAEGLGFLKD